MNIKEVYGKASKSVASEYLGTPPTDTFKLPTTSNMLYLI